MGVGTFVSVSFGVDFLILRKTYNLLNFKETLKKLSVFKVWKFGKLLVLGLFLVSYEKYLFIIRNSVDLIDPFDQLMRLWKLFKISRYRVFDTKFVLSSHLSSCIIDFMSIQSSRFCNGFDQSGWKVSPPVTFHGQSPLSNQKLWRLIKSISQSLGQWNFAPKI